MPKAVGLDAGEFEVKVVELDGSYRRPRLTRFDVQPVAAGSPSAADEEHASRGAEAALCAFDESGIGKEHFSMSFPCREAVLRSLNVPFVGTDQIRKVIKFEAEGEIHSHSVDDMVVDFLELARGVGQTRVLVAAVPKPSLRLSLTALENSGIEPEFVDLDTMALFRAAEWCGVFEDQDESEAPSDPVELMVPEAPRPARLVIDLGARSTRVLVVVGGQLVDMRALRTGSDSMAAEISESLALDMVQAREAVEECLRTDGDFIVVEADEEEEEAEAGLEPGEEREEAATQLVPLDAVEAARDRYLQRLRRELVRFLSSVPSASDVEQVWVTGGASRAPGLQELLQDVLGTTPRKLDVLEGISHRLDPEQVEELGPKLAVAVGLALDQMAGRAGFNFRQEDLAFTKGFDRIKFPLAITCMLALFLVLVFALRSLRELQRLEAEYGSVYSVKHEERRGHTTRTVLFNGYVGSLVNDGLGWFTKDKYFDPHDYDQLVDKLLKADTFKRLGIIRREIVAKFRELQRKSGYYPDLRLGSGLGALVEVAELLRSIEPQLGRYLLTDIEVKLEHQDAARYVKFTVALRTDEKSDFRIKWQTLEQAIKARCEEKTTCLLSLSGKESGQKPPPFVSEDGNGAFYRVRIDLKPEKDYPTFPPKES